MKQVKIKLFLIILQLLFGFNNFLFSQKNSLDGEESGKKLMVGIKVSPPFIIENPDGKYSGVSVDLWSMISQKLGVDYEYKVYQQNEIK